MLTTPMQYESRLSSTPDIDLINVIIQHQVKVQCALDFGCEKGQSSEYMRAYTGADQYIGLDAKSGLARGCGQDIR